MTMNTILCALLNGSFEPTEFIINNGDATEDQLFQSLCYNPALAVPLNCAPDIFAMSFDLIKSDTISRPIETDDNNSPTNFLSSTWLEPQLPPTTFDACHAAMAKVLTRNDTLISFDELELPHALIDFDDAYDLYVRLRSRSETVKPTFDSQFWLSAIHTRATGSA